MGAYLRIAALIVLTAGVGAAGYYSYLGTAVAVIIPAWLIGGGVAVVTICLTLAILSRTLCDIIALVERKGRRKFFLEDIFEPLKYWFLIPTVLLGGITWYFWGWAIGGTVAVSGYALLMCGAHTLWAAKLGPWMGPIDGDRKPVYLLPLK